MHCIISRDFGAARTAPGPPPVATRQPSGPCNQGRPCSRISLMRLPAHTRL
ncbi:hypothetical protein BBTM_01279 [Bifidobacterium bifidum]|nr:hypothetical protein BBTM_01279 [Bifidobacterium bifidum]